MKNQGGISEFVLPVVGCLGVVFLFTCFTIHITLENQFDHVPPTALFQAGRIGRRPPRQNPRSSLSPRYLYEQEHKLTAVDVQSRVEKLRHDRTIETVDNDKVKYNIHRCPPEIPPNYPVTWNIIDVLTHWNPDDTNIPLTIYQGLCAIDWNDPEQQKIAVHYRKAELPFVVHNHPEIWKATERWSHYDYVHNLVGDVAMRNEHSKNNHMMYWKVRARNRWVDQKGWTPPTENVDLAFADWYEKALALEDPSVDVAHTEHYYFRLSIPLGGSTDYLYDELPLFDPHQQSDLFMVNPSDARGINCRFGSRGVIAETHYDASRNFILLLGGQKRYIVAHPDQCLNMELYPMGHPSARHSRINWSDPTSWLQDGVNFHKAQVNEVVLQAGDGLYLPTYWFHFIVSLNINYQCNTRSGISNENQHLISKCGF